MRASILLPYRDAEATIAEALDSVLREPGDYEVLAIDDGSRDDGPRIVASIAARDPRVRRLEAGGNGLVAALNHGIEHARASFLVRMDADDRHHAPRIDAIVTALEGDASLGIVGTEVSILCEDEVGAGLGRYVDWQNRLHSAEDHAREVFVESPLCHPSFGMRSSVVRALGGYRQGPFPEDYDLVLRVHRAGLALRKLPFVGLAWRHHEGRLTFRDPRYSTDAFRTLKIEHLLPSLQASGRPTYVWGAGRDGRRFAKALLERGHPVDRFIDIDPAKIGRTAYGRPIVAMESLPGPEGSFVVVSVGTSGARALIRAALVARGYREIEDFRCVA